MGEQDILTTGFACSLKDQELLDKFKEYTETYPGITVQEFIKKVELEY
jgi:hypothetical protein